MRLERCSATGLEESCDTTNSSFPVVWCSRCSEKESSFLTPALGKEMPFLATPLVPALSSTPAAALLASDVSSADSTPQSTVSIRKRRRLAASPGGLHWTSTGERRLLAAIGRWKTFGLVLPSRGQHCHGPYCDVFFLLQHHLAMKD